MYFLSLGMGAAPIPEDKIMNGIVRSTMVTTKRIWLQIKMDRCRLVRTSPKS